MFATRGTQFGIMGGDISDVRIWCLILGLISKPSLKQPSIRQIFLLLVGDVYRRPVLVRDFGRNEIVRVRPPSIDYGDSSIIGVPGVWDVRPISAEVGQRTSSP